MFCDYWRLFILYLLLFLLLIITIIINRFATKMEEKEEHSKETSIDTPSTGDVSNSFDVFDLITDAESEKQIFMKLASFKPVDKEKTAKRCSPFPYRPLKSVFTELYDNGYESWVSKTVKGVVSQKATIDQTAQFIAFCKDKLKQKLT
jgi:hypothetical protein